MGVFQNFSMRHLPHSEHKGAHELAVLIRDDNGMYRAYIGLTFDCEGVHATRASHRDVIYVGTSGYKIPFSELRRHFPQVPEKAYAN